MARRRRSFSELSRGGWGREFEHDADGDPVGVTDNELIIGATIRTADRLDSLVVLVRSLRDALDRIERLLDPVAQAERAKDAAAAEKRRKAAESLARAEAAYRGVKPPGPAGLARPVADLNISVRARKCMNRLNITTLGELCQRTADELLEAKNFGKTTLAEVRERLAAFGLTLAGDEPAQGG